MNQSINLPKEESLQLPMLSPQSRLPSLLKNKASRMNLNGHESRAQIAGPSQAIISSLRDKDKQLMYSTAMEMKMQFQTFENYAKHVSNANADVKQEEHPKKSIERLNSEVLFSAEELRNEYSLDVNVVEKSGTLNSVESMIN